MDPSTLSIKMHRKHVPANQRQYTGWSLAKHIFPSYLPGLRVELRVKSIMAGFGGRVPEDDAWSVVMMHTMFLTTQD